MSTKIGELSLEFSCTIAETINTENPSRPTFVREKDSHVSLFRCELFQVECLLFTWAIRACLFMDCSDAIYVFLQFVTLYYLHVLSE
jgi:hypothetical protein